jgi:arylsulfatase A-like enzyme
MKHASAKPTTHLRTSTDRRRAAHAGRLRVARVTVIVAIALAFAPVPAIRSAPRAAPDAAIATTRPNVLIIVMDDQRDQGTLAVQPNVRRLFQSGGVTFSNAFDTTPLCCPARGSLFSGRYPHNTGVRTNADPDSEQRFDQKTTLVYHLKNAGYATAMAGKYWNKWPQSTPPPYFDHFAMTGGGYLNAGFNVDGTQKTVMGYNTDVIGNFATQDLQTFEANDAQPWFLYLATQAPHSPFEPSATYANAAVPAWDQSPAVLEADRSDKPTWIKQSTTPLADVETTRRQQLRTLMSVDDMVAQVFAKMDALGESDATIAFFISDNGYMWGEHGQIEKRAPYTDSISIPMYMRWPGQVAAGSVDARLVTQMDITPTIYDVVGITPGYTVDGVSLFAPGARQRMFLEYRRSPDALRIPSWGSEITATRQYIEWYNRLGDADPGNDPPYADISAQLHADMVCVGTACPQPESQNPDTSPPTTPGMPTGTSVRAGQIDLTWPASTDDRATSITYRVFRDGGAVSVGTVTSASATTVAFTDVGLTAASTHTYRVTASDGTNVSQLSPVSAPITVVSAAPVIFRDEFSGGLGAWNNVRGITIDATAGRSAPSALARATGSIAYAFHGFGATYPAACASVDVRLNSIGNNGVALFRFRTAGDQALGRVSLSSARKLFVRADRAGVAKYSAKVLPLSTWSSIELCGTTGTSGTWRLYLDGVSILGPWTVNNGTSPFGAINLIENTTKAVSVNLDNLVVDDHVG